jgi:hemolysin D
MSSADARRPRPDLRVVGPPRQPDGVGREFLPAALEILETPPSPAGRMTAWLIVGFVILTVGWSILGRVEIIATATGKVVPTARTKTVQPLEAGTISAILVRDGDRVSNGQLLIALDNTVAAADRDRAAQDLSLSRLDVARLTALRASFDHLNQVDEVLAPKSVRIVDLERAKASLIAQAGEQLAKVDGLASQIRQKKAEHQTTGNAIAKLEAVLPLVEETASVRRKAMEIQYGNRIAYLDAQTRLLDQQGELAVQRNRLAEIDAATRSLEQQIDQARSAFEKQALIDLSEAQRKVDGYEQELIKAQRKLEERLVRSPTDGTVQQLVVHTVGGVVTPAQQLMTIVPLDSCIEVEAMVSNRDIGFVREGQVAAVKVDTFNFTRYGLMDGRVIGVSRDAITREAPSRQQSVSGDRDRGIEKSSEPAGQEMLYAARIELDRSNIMVDGKAVDLAPGKAVTAEIKTGSRRVIEYVLDPLVKYRHEGMRER